MPSYRPPTTAPTPDASKYQTPPVLHYTIDPSKWDQSQGGMEAAAEALVQQYASNIQRFIQINRQKQHNSGLKQNRVQMTLDGLEVDWTHNNGGEDVHIIVSPSSKGGQKPQILVDINYDGYIAWTHQWFQLEAPAVDTFPYDVVLNGFQCVTGYTPPDSLFVNKQPQLPSLPPPPYGSQWPPSAAVCVILAFGPTALCCQSLHDKQNTFANAPGSGGFAAQCQPPRADIKALGIIPGHKDLFGYFPFDWGDQFNPNDWAYTQGSEGQGPLYSYDANFCPVKITYIVQFKNALNSPLNAKGPNTVFFRASRYPPTAGQNASNYILAEFYNRAQLRAMNESWHYNVQLPSFILANDKPMCFNCQSDDPFSDIGTRAPFQLSFDLTPANNPPNTATFGINNTNPGIANVPLTPTETAAEEANAAAAITYGAAYAAALSALQTAFSNLQNDFSTYQTMTSFSPFGTSIAAGRAYVLNPTSANYTALSVACGGEIAIINVTITYCTAVLAYQASPQNASARSAVIAAATGESLLEFDAAAVLANVDMYNWSVTPSAGNLAILSNDITTITGNLNTYFPGSPLITTINNDFSTLQTAQTNYQTVLAEYLPVTNVAPNQTQSIDRFNYRIITVVNGVYTIGPWSQG